MNSRIIIFLAVSLLVFPACNKKPVDSKPESATAAKKIEKAKPESDLSKPKPTSEPASSKSVPGTDKTMMKKDETVAKAPVAVQKLTPPTMDDVGDQDEVAVIETEKGEIVLEFYPDIAPMHVANFKKLAKAGFYDGTGFHRVLPGFVIQGGDPNTKDSNPHNDGQGGPPYQVNAEFSDRQHVKGTLSMARSQDNNSAGSQFYICLDRKPHLDKKYTVFGGVIKGMEAVDKIGSLRRDPSNRYDRELPMIVMRRVRIVKKSELGL